LRRHLEELHGKSGTKLLRDLYHSGSCSFVESHNFTCFVEFDVICNYILRYHGESYRFHLQEYRIGWRDKFQPLSEGRRQELLSLSSSVTFKPAVRVAIHGASMALWSQTLGTKCKTQAKSKYGEGCRWFPLIASHLLDGFCRDGFQQFRGQTQNAEADWPDEDLCSHLGKSEGVFSTALGNRVRLDGVVRLQLFRFEFTNKGYSFCETDDEVAQCLAEERNHYVRLQQIRDAPDREPLMKFLALWGADWVGTQQHDLCKEYEGPTWKALSSNTSLLTIHGGLWELTRRWHCFEAAVDNNEGSYLTFDDRTLRLAARKRCAQMCISGSNCVAFSFQRDASSCQLHTSSNLQNSEVLGATCGTARADIDYFTLLHPFCKLHRSMRRMPDKTQILQSIL